MSNCMECGSNSDRVVHWLLELMESKDFDLRVARVTISKLEDKVQELEKQLKEEEANVKTAPDGHQWILMPTSRVFDINQAPLVINHSQPPDPNQINC